MEERKQPFLFGEKFKKKELIEQITDIMGFRIIMNNVEDCYKALGIFHSNYNCIPGRFKDYISSPKINNYQSIHTAIIGPNKRPIEIQLRTMSCMNLHKEVLHLIGNTNHRKKLIH